MLDEPNPAQDLDPTEHSIATSRTDRTRSLDALHRLESFAATAAPGRETDWLSHVRDALRALDAALDEQERNSAVSESPLSGIEHDEPRLWNRVVQLRERYRDLASRVSELRTQLDSPTRDGIDVADIRRRLERVAAELRYQQSREADLVYEAYSVDLGGGD
jgi:small-conductance mechanosensitive channel